MAYLFAIATIIAWGSAFVAIRAAVRPGGYSPGHLTLLRFLSASATLMVCSFFFHIRRPALGDLSIMLLMGLVGVALYHGMLNYAETRVSAGAASFLINLSPIFTVLAATLFLEEHLRWGGWCGIGVSLAGALVIAMGESHGVTLNLAMFLVLFCAVCNSFYTICNKRLLVRYSPLEISCYAVWIATLFLMIFAPGFGTAVYSASPEATLSGVYLGVFPAALAYVSWGAALNRMPASLAVNFMYLMPAVTMIIAWLWLREPPRLMTIIGGCIAVAGVMIVVSFGREKRVPKAA
jgi:drug/metabolite transporter (DMT)-like permease